MRFNLNSTHTFGTRLCSLSAVLLLSGSLASSVHAKDEPTEVTQPGAMSSLNLVVTELLPYQIGCERRHEDETNCDLRCDKADELGYIRDPDGGLAYNPAAVSLGNGRFEILTQTGCEGDFLESYELDLVGETLDYTGLIRDTSMFNCPDDLPGRPPRPQVLGGPDILPIASTCGSRQKGLDPKISFFTYGNSDIYRGRLGWAYTEKGNTWTIGKDPFLFFPLCTGRNGICETLGVATVAALDVGDYYYLYVNLFNGGPQGILLMRVEKSCEAPYVILGPGGAQVFNKSTRIWEDMAFDAQDGYLFETCPVNPGDFNAYNLIPNGSSLGVTQSSDGFLLTHKRGAGNLFYLRSDEPTFNAGAAPSHTIDASLLPSYYQYELCPGGVAPTNQNDPCIYNWDVRNHHIELEEAPGGGYYMFFTRMNSTDENKFRFASVRVARVQKAPGFTPLLAPSGITASDGTDPHRVDVSWNTVNAATEYEIWRNTVQKPNAGSLIGTVPAPNTTFLDDTVQPGVTYHYWVRAKNAQTTSGYSPSNTGFSMSLTCRQGRLQAESGQLSGAFVVGNAGSTQFIHVPDGDVGGAQAPTNPNRASYCVTVPSTGNYRVQGRVRALGFAADSFYLRIDGGSEFLWVTRPFNQFGLDEVNDTRGSNIIDPVEVHLTAGDHIIEVILREDGTQLDYLELVSAEPQPTCAGLTQQAEAGVLSSDFRIVTAGGRTYIEVPDGQVGGAINPDENRKASYCVVIPSTGTYKVVGQVRAPSFAADSFYVRFDGQAESLWAVSPHNNWVSDEVNDTRGSTVVDPQEFFLTAGEHTLDFMLREDGTQLDSFSLVEVTPPSNCGGLSQEAEDGDLSPIFDVITEGNRTYIEVPDGQVGGAQGVNENWKASYCVDVPISGTYRIQGEVRAPSFGADSFYVRLDGQATNLWAISPHNNWVTDFVNDTRGSNIVDPVEVFLTAGEHTLDVFLREDGSQLDKLTLIRQ